MKGKLFQVNNVDGEPIGLFHTKDKSITTVQIDDWFRSFDDSDLYDEEGVNGFVEFVAQIGYEIERVFVENVNI
jgi:hypothetical protein